MTQSEINLAGKRVWVAGYYASKLQANDFIMLAIFSTQERAIEYINREVWNHLTLRTVIQQEIFE